MPRNPSASTAPANVPLGSGGVPRRVRQGEWLGALGVLVFAFSIPMTRLASGSEAAPQLDPVFVALGRAAVAGLLAAGWLALTRSTLPAARLWPGLALTAAGVVFGWPLLLGLAVRRVEATHAAVVSGLLPLATAALGALMLRQRPSRGFWLFAILGAAMVVAFAAWRGGGWPQAADALLLGAVLCASFGYVTGAHLGRADAAGPSAGTRAGGGLTPEQVISWVLVLSLPFTLPVLVMRWPAQPVHASAWAGFAYVSVFSMWLGFFAWYRGLAWGGTLRVSQIQLLQPFASLLLAVPVLGERLEPATVVFSLAVMACVFLGRRMAIETPPPMRAAEAAPPPVRPADLAHPSHPVRTPTS